LSALFGDNFVKEAHKHSKLFNSWEDITAKNGIAAASAHSRIKNLEKGILLIEMDHPGWKQILQTKQSKLLNDFRYRFPDMNICGIALMLGKSDKNGQFTEDSEQSKEINNQSDISNQSSVSANHHPFGSQFDVSSVPPDNSLTETSVAADIEAIKDDELKQKLLSLGQAIAEREKV